MDPELKGAGSSDVAHVGVLREWAVVEHEDICTRGTKDLADGSCGYA
jgi:hypothetical protein